MLFPNAAAPLLAPQAVLGPQEVDVDEEEEEEGAEEEVDVEELVVAVRDVVRDDLGHGEGQAQDDQDLAVEGRDHGLQRVPRKGKGERGRKVKGVLLILRLKQGVF